MAGTPGRNRGSTKKSGTKNGTGKINIIIDQREKRTKTHEWLKTFGASILERQLDVADYIVSGRVGIERKTVSDFLECVTNQRLFEQMEKLTETFERPLLILEGDQKMLFLERKMHPNAIHGVLSSITLDYGIPIIWTHSPRVTAAQIYWTAHREQNRENRCVRVRSCKKTKSLAEQQQFILAGLPDVNSKLGRRLLERFGTVRKVFSAKEEKLLGVEGVGKKKARNIWCLLNSEYEEE